jgi:hypothetical protein
MAYLLYWLFLFINCCTLKHIRRAVLELACSSLLWEECKHVISALHINKQANSSTEHVQLAPGRVGLRIYHTWSMQPEWPLAYSAASSLAPWRTGNGDQMGWMGATNLFRNLQLLSSIQLQEANTKTVMITTLEKNGCSLGAQRVTTKRTNRRANEHRTDRRENETLHFYGEETRSQISDTQANWWQEHLDRVYGTVGSQRNRRNAKRSSNAQATDENTGRSECCQKNRTCPVCLPDTSSVNTGHGRYTYRTHPVCWTAHNDVERKLKNPIKRCPKIMRF